MSASELRHNPPPRRPLDEAELEEVGLVDVLDRVGLLAEGDRQRGEADGTAVELVEDGPEKLAVDPLEALAVHLEQRERFPGDCKRDHSVVSYLGHVPHPSQDAIGYSRGAAGAAGGPRRSPLRGLNPPK